VVEEQFDTVEVSGQKVEAITSASGLVIGLNKKTSTKFARLAHIGKPPVGSDELKVGQGAMVIINKNSNFKNTIEGKEYYTVRQGDILCAKA
jgi:co-chaperonin GroES (HSP10)